MTGQKDGSPPHPVPLSELPVDELIRYGQQLGVDVHAGMNHGELLRRIRERQELLLELDRQALLDIVVWARHPVRESAGKEELARQIATILKMDFRGLSDRGLRALARLRGLSVGADEPRDRLEARLKAAEPLWNRLVRARRRIVASLIERAIAGREPADTQKYQFLPEEKRAPSLKQDIAEEGVVGGIARRIRGVADDYVREKLDEIEARIDRKLDEIDRRLEEWRDREIANRLRIIKITLAASVIVALLSLGYNFVVSRVNPAPPATTPAGRLENPQPCSAMSRWV